MKLLDTGLNVDAEEEVPGGGDAGGDGVASQRKASHPNAKEEVRGFDAGAAAAVVALLQEIGLNKYARIFLKQEVDLESLLQFGDQDLKDIGVVAIGARRKAEHPLLLPLLPLLPLHPLPPLLPLLTLLTLLTRRTPQADRRHPSLQAEEDALSRGRRIQLRVQQAHGER